MYLKAYFKFLELNNCNYRLIAEKDFNHINGIKKYNDIYHSILNKKLNFEK